MSATRVSTSFWDRIAERYAERPVPNEAIYQRKLALTRQYLRADDSVLEVGCGTGSTALSHAPYVSHIHATDVSGGMIDVARRRAGQSDVSNVTFEAAAIENIDLPDESVDVILALNLLHLVADRQAAIEDMQRWLKPGGVLVTSTVCLGDKMRWFRFVAPIGKALGFMPMVKVFAMDDLRNDLVDAGFTQEIDWPTADGRTLFTISRKPE